MTRRGAWVGAWLGAALLVFLLLCGAGAPAAAGAESASAGPPAAFPVAQLSREEQSLPSSGEMTPEQAARTLLDVAASLEQRGELAAARLLLREIVERYDGTVAAAEALERLSALEGRPDFVPGEMPPAEPPARPDSLAPGGAWSTGRAVSAPPVALPAAGAAPGSAAAAAWDGRLDQSGRIPVIAYSTLMCGWAALSIPIYADAEGGAGYGLALLLGPPAGLVTSMYLTRDRQVTAAQSDVVVMAGNLGIWHALALGGIHEWEGTDVAGAAGLGGLLGTGVGALLVAPGRTRETSAALAGLAVPVGSWLGLVGAELFGGGDGASGDARLGSMLVTGDVALAGSILVAPRLSLSRGRAGLIGMGGALGALTGAAMSLIFDVSGDRSGWSLMGAGTLGGLAGALALTADYDAEHGFSDPPRAGRIAADAAAPGHAVAPERSAGSGGARPMALLPLRLVARPASPPAPGISRWKERLRLLGVQPGPTFGVTLLEARF